jgi:hypothetical protein
VKSFKYCLRQLVIFFIVVKFYNNLILPWLLYFFYLGGSCRREALPPCPRASAVGKMGDCSKSPPFAPLSCACAQPIYLRTISQMKFHKPKSCNLISTLLPIVFTPKRNRSKRTAILLWNWPSYECWSTDIFYGTLWIIVKWKLYLKSPLFHQLFPISVLSPK